MIVKYLHGHRSSKGCTTKAIDEAVASGSLTTVRFLHEQPSEGCTLKAMDEAAAYGHLRVAKFLHKERSEIVRHW